jgi:hypothetical protein
MKGHKMDSTNNTRMIESISMVTNFMNVDVKIGQKQKAKNNF